MTPTRAGANLLMADRLGSARARRPRPTWSPTTARRAGRADASHQRLELPQNLFTQKLRRFLRPKRIVILSLGATLSTVAAESDEAPASAECTAAHEAVSRGIRIIQPFGQPHPLDPRPAHQLAEDIDRQTNRDPPPFGAHSQPSPSSRTAISGCRGLDADASVRSIRKSDSPTSVFTTSPRSSQDCRNLVTVPIDHGHARRGVIGRRDSARGEFEIRLQVLEPTSRSLLSAKLSGIEARIQHDLSSRTSDGDIQPAFAARARQRSEVQREHSAVVLAEGDREQNRVALVTLHALEVLHEQAIAFVERAADAFIRSVAQHVVDEVALLDVERDDADRRCGVAGGGEPTDHLVDDRLRFDAIRP